MFDSISTAPPDAILGISEAFAADSNPDKINLSVGVYKDAAGKTPVLPSVKEAERRLLENEASKSYMLIGSAPQAAAGKLIQQLMFGADSPIVTENRAGTAHTPGGTGALRVAADYLKKMHPDSAVWMSDPTWANHPAIFNSAGLEVKTYPYFDADNNRVDFEAMLEAMRQVPAGDVVLLHGCCHNPTGADPTVEQWEQLADIFAERGILPLIDFAYQGFAVGVEEDAAGLRAVAEKCKELFVCNSFSKNFGLYCERIGAFTVVAGSTAAMDAVMSHIKQVIRVNFSNPPAHGPKIVAEILGDEKLCKQWVQELAEMRDRINGMRELFVKTLAAKGVKKDMSFITSQNGMFSFSGLTKEQVQKLRDEYSIYIVGSGRINVAGMTEDNMDKLCTAIAAVM